MARRDGREEGEGETEAGREGGREEGPHSAPLRFASGRTKRMDGLRAQEGMQRECESDR